MTPLPRPVTAHAYARAGLIGNPSDGYHGKTIAVPVKNFVAKVSLEPSDELVIAPHQSDTVRCGSLQELAEQTRRFGYYGGLRLMQAAIVVFWDYCRSQGIAGASANFRLRYRSDIPRLVGLAGSSALVTACLKALAAYYRTDIPLPVLANLALVAERDQLGIAAGLQDRVVQAYESLVYMDFSPALMERQGYGDYRPIDPRLLPPLYLAYDSACAEGSERTHNTLRARFDARDELVVDAMSRLAELAEQAYTLLQDGHPLELKPLMNRGFDLRRSICTIAPAHLRMIETAQAAGASAQFAGSGGAIIGIYDDEAMYGRLQTELAAIGCSVILPLVR